MNEEEIEKEIIIDEYLRHFKKEYHPKKYEDWITDKYIALKLNRKQ